MKNRNLSQRQHWGDHPQTDSLYDAEGAWMKEGLAGERLNHKDAKDFLHRVVGRPVSLLVNPRLAIPARNGSPEQPIAYMAHKGNLIVNPSVVGDTLQAGFLTHEGAHLLGAEGHGPELASKHLEVVRKILGDGEADRLQHHYARLKVSS